jgi:ribonuclease HI
MSKYIIICDGGCYGNHLPNKAGHGYGSYVVEGDVNQRVMYDFGPGLTNNDAEYLIIIKALQSIRERIDQPLETDVLVKTDSALVIGHMTQNWKVKALNLLARVVDLGKEIHNFHSVTFEKVSGQDVKRILGH